MTAKRTALVLALVVYVASFFLPAVRDQQPEPNVVMGYTCAINTLTQTWNMEDWHESVPMFLAGCVNPALALYALTFWIRRPRAQRVFRFLPAVLLLAAWYTIYAAGVIPLIGHFLWAGSVLAMVALGGGRKRPQEAPVEQAPPAIAA